MNWKLWIKAAAVRAVKTIAQAAVATITSAIIAEVDQQVQIVRYDDDRSDDAPIFEEDN